MSRDDVLRAVSEARAKGETPDLLEANLEDANLRGADLEGANLRFSGLWFANLRFANLRFSNLEDANLRFSDLWGANLWGANLRGADLEGANLRGALWGGLRITDLPSGQLTLIPTPDGWQLHVGCWHGTPDKLRDMIAQDEGWPEAEGDEIERRRPYLQAALALCEVHMKDHADVINDLKEKWG